MIDNIVQQDDHTWAEEAKEEMAERSRGIGIFLHWDRKKTGMLRYGKKSDGRTVRGKD